MQSFQRTSIGKKKSFDSNEVNPSSLWFQFCHRRRKSIVISPFENFELKHTDITRYVLI